MDPLDLLRRTDKWFLAGGTGSLYAPPFPRFLGAPGFWDECYFADVRLPRLFTCLSPQGPTFGSVVYWRPDRLVIEHRASFGRVQETSCVLDSFGFVSEFLLQEATGPVDWVTWIMLPVRAPGSGTPWQSVTDVRFVENALIVKYETRWPAEFAPDRTATEQENLDAGSQMLAPLPIYLAFGADHPISGRWIQCAQRHDESPEWRSSMMPELWNGHQMISGGSAHLDRLEDGVLHAYLASEMKPGKPFRVACGAGTSPETALASLRNALEQGSPASERSWRKFFQSVPQFEADDPYLTNAYWYRWYGLRLNTIDVPGLPMRTERGVQKCAPYVAEGIGFFRNFITYSSQCMLREAAWMHDPSLAHGIVQNLESCQRVDGSIPGHNYSARPPRDFYHADFAPGLSRLLHLHGKQAGDKMMRRYADYYLGARRPADGTGLAEVWDQNETGQEYMSRYLAASPTADKWESFRVGGIDSSAYALATAGWVRRRDEAVSLAAAMAQSFDREDAFFCDLLLDHTRSHERPATGFYAFLEPGFSALRGLVGDEAMQSCLRRWLLSEEQFWLQAGFPATALSDSTFRANPEWKEVRMNCPWNGRSWPMVNSHLVDATANAARAWGGPWYGNASDALAKAIRLLFHDDDPARPCCYEHYNPITGTPALYRGYDDYMHSWVVDLVLRHVVGVRFPSETRVEGAKEIGGGWQIDPVPVEGDWTCEAIPVGAGRKLDARKVSGRVWTDLRT